MPSIITGADAPKNLDNRTSGISSDTVYSETKTSREATNAVATPQIINKSVPIVIFIGPPSSGKSMILVRLAKYLHNDGYTIETDPTFLNTTGYRNDCREFNSKLSTNVALAGSVKFLLIKVYNSAGQEIAKLLEAPGEDFYTTDPKLIADGKNERIEPYLSSIMASSNPKSHVVLLDLDSDISFRNDSLHRDEYTKRYLKHFYPSVKTGRDRVILLYNKIDMTPFGSINGCNNPREARKDAEMYYRQLFATMKVKKLGGFITADNFRFKTFCTGLFSNTTDTNGNDIKTYNTADDIFPCELWNEITRKW